jgi:hypothetical protein
MPWFWHAYRGWLWVPEPYGRNLPYQRYPVAYAIVPPNLQPLLMDIGKGVLIYLSGKLAWSLGENARDFLRARFGNLPSYFCLYCGGKLAYAPEYARWYCPNDKSWY